MYVRHLSECTTVSPIYECTTTIEMDWEWMRLEFPQDIVFVTDADGHGDAGDAGERGSVPQ